MTATVSRSVQEELRSAALGLGFAACGFTSAAPIAREALLGEWIARGRHADMDYLAREPDARLDPRRTLAEAASVVVVRWPYPPPPPPDPAWKARLTGRIAAYALGADYHQQIAARLGELAELVAARCGGTVRVHVDGGPLLERELAARAGLGWLGHNTLLLSRGAGSYFLLGCLLTQARFEPDPPAASDHCGRCRACLPGCPTGALDSGPTIDARLCISYLTIEHRGPISRALRPQLQNWVFGCDLCQTVCPWNAPPQAPAASMLQPSLPELLLLGREEFRDRYEATAVSRAKRRGLARNAAVALGNSANEDAIAPLATALRTHDEALVRAHAAWALGRFATSGAERALAAARKRERVPPVLEEIDLSLARAT